MGGFSTSTHEVPACGRCGEPLVPGEPFCAGCGARVVASCRHCGNSLVPGEPFCPHCGTPLGAVEDKPDAQRSFKPPVPQGRDDAGAPPAGYQNHYAIPLPSGLAASGHRFPRAALLGGMVGVLGVVLAALTLLLHSGGPPKVQGTSTPAAQDTPTVSAQATVTPAGAGTTAATSVWSQQTSGTDLDLVDVACPSPSTCVAVGAVGGYGTILRTTDGGNTWSSQTTDMTSDNNLNSVACPSSSICFAVGDSGTILRTTNAGSP